MGRGLVAPRREVEDTAAPATPSRGAAAVLVMVAAQGAMALGVAAGRAAQQVDRAAFPGEPGIGVLEILFSRSLVMCLACTAALALARPPRTGERRLPPGSLRWIAARSGFGSLGALCYFYGGLTIPLGANQLLLNTSVFFVGVLAHHFIGETYTRGRFVLSLAGFSGVGLLLAGGLLGPGSAGAPVGYVVSFGSAVFTAAAMFSIRKAQAVDGTYIVLGTGLAGLATSLAGFVWLGVHLPRLPLAALLLGLCALAGAVSQFCMTWAMRSAPASLVAPAQFSGPVLSLGLGAALFAERLGPVQLAGGAIALVFGVLLPLRAPPARPRSDSRAVWASRR